MASAKQVISEADFQEILRPRLLLFLSVDVVGSTAFKHASHIGWQIEGDDALTKGWLDFFTSFYQDFPAQLETALSRIVSEKGHKGDLPKPELWKAQGDELIFTVELTHRSNAAVYVKAFRDAVLHEIKHYTRGEETLPVSFKATGWLAGFPIGNAIVPFEVESGKLIYDYLGPQIDIGFRLSSGSTPRRFSVSVDLAYLILKAAAHDLTLYYEGREPLKGVLRERKYPRIWIDCPLGNEGEDRDYEKDEDKLLGRKPADSEILERFCKHFIEDMGDPLIPPFIAADAKFISPPENYQEKIKQMETRLRRIFEVEEPESKAEKSASSTKEIKDLENWKPPRKGRSRGRKK